MSDMWQSAANQFHSVREMDKHTSLFRCMTCNCWFDQQLQIQMDNNFRAIGKEIEICPIAQAMMFSDV